MKVEFVALGAGQEVGRRCLLLIFVEADFNIMLDGGAHPNKQDGDRVPDCSKIPDNLKAIIITHYHLDHSAGLPYITELDGRFENTQVIMTLPTKVLAPLVLQDYCKGGNQDLYLPVHIERAFSKVTLIKLLERQSLRDVPDLFVTAFYAGHVIGGIMVLLEYKGSSIIYIGDYSVEPDLAHLDGASIPTYLLPKTGIDLIISEATFATSVREDPKLRCRKFTDAVQRCIEANGVCLLPVFSIGRAQELASLIHSRVLGDYRIYTTNENSVKAFNYYRLFQSWMIDGGMHMDFPNVTLLKEEEHMERPCVVLASPSILEVRVVIVSSE